MKNFFLIYKSYGIVILSSIMLFLLVIYVLNSVELIGQLG